MFYGIFTLRRLSISGNPHSVQLSAFTLETEIECGSDSLFICLSSTAFICGHVSERIPERVSLMTIFVIVFLISLHISL